MKLVITLAITLLLFTKSQADLIWTVGLPGDGWPQDLGNGGGEETVFVQETGVNDLPGNPASPVVGQQSDDDYYFAGVYTTVVDGGNYDPVGPVAENEQGAERAFAGSDNTLRYHFNFPSTIGAATPLTVSWDAHNLHNDAADPRYGVEVYVNGTRVAGETLIRGDELGVINTTPAFTLADVNGETGEGFDNYVELRGINYNAEGGGNWMGVDHVSLDAELSADGIFVVTDVALTLTGAVQMSEFNISNPSQATPRTINEIEIVGDDASKFTIDTALPFTIDPEVQQTVAYTVDPSGDLGTLAASFVIETDKEEVSIQLAGTIHDPVLASIAAIDFGESETSASQTLEISNTGLSQDLVIESITITGSDAFSATNPGTIAAGAMGQSTVTFAAADPGPYNALMVINSNDPVFPMIEVTLSATVPSEGTLVWTVGLPGDGWPQGLGRGGGPETIFVQETGTNELPGEPDNSTVPRMSDDDYYFAGVYNTVLDGGDYEPLGRVANNEEGAERAFAGSDNTLRYHFNFPTHIGATTPLWVSWDANNLHTGGGDDPRYGVEVWFNGNQIAEETIIRSEQLSEEGGIHSTPTFTLNDVNGEAGEGFDNYVELRGINYNGEGGGNWMGLDHVSLNALNVEPGPNIFVQSRMDLGQLDLGAQEIILSVSNVGTDNALAISGVTTSGPDADRITIVDFPATIAPGADAEIKYTLDPGRTGEFQFNFDIASNDVDEEDKNRRVAVTAAVINLTGPAAHYALDDAEGSTEMRDITGHGRHGTYDGVTLGQGALIPTGTAGGFGGGSFGEIPGASLQMTDFTVSMWANPSELGDIQTLFGQGSGSPSFALLFTQTEVSWFVGDDIVLSTETSPIAASTLVQVAATYDSAGPTVTLFVDGVEVARQEGAPEVDLNDSEQDPFYIGAFASALPFTGTLDDVQVYNRALNADDIKTLFDTPGSVLGEIEVPSGRALVDLDASGLAGGAIASWSNAGTLGGDFQASGDPTVEVIDGVTAVTLDGNGDYFEGPASTPEIEGDSGRSIVAWVYNPELASEETVISWGKRGGPDGTNMSFNHGFHNNFGAVGHWGGDGPDIGWNPNSDVEGDDPNVLGDAEEGIWTHISYTQTGASTKVFTNGLLTNSEDAALDTFAGLGILVGAQREGNGVAVTDGLKGSLSIARLRVFDSALSDEDVLADFEASAADFDRGGGDSALIAHFPLDNDGNSSDGAFVASTSTDVEFGVAGANGNTGTSATFNGTSSLIQHDWSTDLNPESFTLALWAKSDGGAGAWNSPVTSRHDLNPDSQGYLIYDNQPDGAWTFWSGNGTVEGNWQVLDGPAVNVGEWQHVAITYDNASETKKLYVDGALVAEANDSVTPNDTTPFNIGSGEDFGTGFRFVGQIDDIGLWNVPHDAASIVSIMEGGVANFTGGDVGRPVPGAPIVVAIVSSADAVGLSFTGAEGKTYDIQYSADLQTWVSLETGLQGEINYEDTDAARIGNPAGYYRGVEQ